MDIQELIKKDKASRNFTVEFEEAFFKMRRPQQMEFYAFMARCGIRTKNKDGTDDEIEIESSKDAEIKFLMSVVEFIHGWDNVKYKDLSDEGDDTLVPFSKEALEFYLDRHPAAYGALSNALQNNYNAHYSKEDTEKKASANTAGEASPSASLTKPAA